MMDNIIEVSDVTFEYTDNDNVSTVLKNLSLSVERGSFTVILGHNGSGKSTLAKLMSGLLKPDSGTVTVDGITTADEQNEIEVHRRVGMVFQNPDNQIVATIVEEDVAFGPENLGLPPNVIRERVDSALKTVDMYDYRLHAPHKLSGGQKQRVAIAGIIAMEPECIVFDEPTSMLDPKGRREVMDTIYRLNKEKNITIVLITHYMEEVEKADRVVVMDSGEILLDGKPSDVFSQVKKIKEIGLDVPQTTELLYLLKQNGYELPDGVIATGDCVSELLALLRRENCGNTEC
ncbi:MAG: energy-coupling factor transporter ATPase [Acutalibacteraceae bacterium]|nr:energy-coupling factor transporter ATPase [Acutalibacteraceae bacterium]